MLKLRLHQLIFFINIGGNSAKGMEALFYLAYVWNLVPTQTLNLADFFLLFQGKLTAAKLPA